MRRRLKIAHSINHFLFNIFRFPGSRKIGRIFSKILLPPLNQLTQVPTLYNFDMWVNKNGGEEIYNLGFYEVGTLDVMNTILQKEDVFIDVGASIGLMSLFASKKCTHGKILSFEPQKERYEIITKNAKLNSCENMTIFNNGLGEKEDHLLLHTDVFSPSIVDTENSKGTTESIAILVLDKVLTSKSIEKVKLMKIDVEGFELNVLKGAKKLLSSEDAPILCIEYVKRLQSLNDNNISIFDYISQINDYRIFQLEKSSNTISKLVEITKENRLRDCDNMYCFTKKHISNLSSSKLFV